MSMWTKKTTLAALLSIASFGPSVEAKHIRRELTSKSAKTVCVEFGFKEDVVLPVGPIPPEDETTCAPTIDDALNPDYDPQQCPVYFEPFYLNGATNGSSQYEQVDGKDAICIVDPITSTDPSEKFIMTYVGRLSSDITDVSGLLFPDTLLSDFDKLSYDYYVKECPSTQATCPREFYTNVYARESETSTTTFFDCRFDFVPASGGAEGTWTTFTFTADTPATRACGNSLCTVGCAGTTWLAGEQHSLNDYIAETSGTAVISSRFAQAWVLNMGDSAAPDAGLQGCYGDIRFTLAGETDVLQFTQD